jgi:hypothetical protein
VATMLGASVRIATLAQAASAAPTTEFLPQSTSTLHAETKLATQGKAMVHGILKCHRKALQAAARGQADDTVLAACLANGKQKWLKGVATLVPRNRGARDDVLLPNALSTVGGAEGAFDQIDIELKRATGRLYCCGTVPLPGDFSGRVPDAGSDPGCTFSNIDKLRAALQRLADALLVCHANLVKFTFKGKGFDLDQCEAAATAKFDARVAKLKVLPVCAQTALARGRDVGAGIVDDMLVAYHGNGGEVAPPDGPSPVAIDPSGACTTTQGATSTCTETADQATCESNHGTFTMHGTCDVNGNSVPNTCPFPSTCDAGETCGNCEKNCCASTPNPTLTLTPTPVQSPPTPAAPFCGDGHCNGTETNTTCPQDCFCGDGICDETEICGGNSDSLIIHCSAANCCCADCTCTVCTGCGPSPHNYSCVEVGQQGVGGIGGTCTSSGCVPP